MGAGNFVKGFFCIYYHMIFILYFVNVVYNIYCFAHIKLFLQLRDESHLIMVYDPLAYCWIWVLIFLLSILALITPWTGWNGKKIWYWKMNCPGRQVPNMLLEKSEEITPERIKRWSQSKNNIQLWIWLVMEVKSDAVKNNIA